MQRDALRLQLALIQSTARSIFSAAILWTLTDNWLQPRRSFADADRQLEQERSRTAPSEARDLILTTYLRTICVDRPLRAAPLK